jgi:hypothetical protein
MNIVNRKGLCLHNNEVWEYHITVSGHEAYSLTIKNFSGSSYYSDYQPIPHEHQFFSKFCELYDQLKEVSGCGYVVSNIIDLTQQNAIGTNAAIDAEVIKMHEIRTLKEALIGEKCNHELIGGHSFYRIRSKAIRASKIAIDENDVANNPIKAQSITYYTEVYIDDYCIFIEATFNDVLIVKYLTWDRNSELTVLKDAVLVTPSGKKVSIKLNYEDVDLRVKVVCGLLINHLTKCGIIPSYGSQ